MGTDDPPDKPKVLSEPKFIIIKRIDNHSMENVSPFIIKKQIDYTCNGEVMFAKKTRDGKLLVKTKNGLQALKLLRLKLLGDHLVEASEHRTLNISKGVIYSNDLRCLTEENIKTELTPQNICDVKKIKKKINNELIDTGLIILSFASTSIPDAIKIGYESVKVRAYIPPPLRCNKCFRFGHISAVCRNTKLCINCSNDFHTNPDNDEMCSNDKCCVNCMDAKLPDNKHSSVYRRCPIFVKKQEIQAIITLEKVDAKKAISIYNSRHPHDGSMYSSIVKTNPTNILDNKRDNLSNSSPILKSHSTSTPHTSRILPTYDDLQTTKTTSETSCLPSTPASSTVKVFPKNISNRAKSQLKAKDKLQSNSINLKKNLPSDSILSRNNLDNDNISDDDMSCP